MTHKPARATQLVGSYPALRVISHKSSVILSPYQTKNKENSSFFVFIGLECVVLVVT